jgi:hypothetical protein
MHTVETVGQLSLSQGDVPSPCGTVEGARGPLSSATGSAAADAPIPYTLTAAGWSYKPAERALHARRRGVRP